ncbi:MAG: tetratricopeptide repeat protein, partial [Cyanobacteria bacterium P01_H01_bin.153]
PAYQRLKQDKGRAETLATLRFKVRRLTRENNLTPKDNLSKQLLEADEAEVEILYEKGLTELSETQYASVENFTNKAIAIAEFNLAYLRRKMGDPVIREKRTGLMSATNKSTVSGAEATPTTPKPKDAPAVDYGQRHVMRAKTYIASKSYSEAVQELRDAVRIEPNNSNYHTMLGQAYLMQKMVGMAKVHIRQALKLDSQNAVARKYAKQLEIEMPSPATTTKNTATKNINVNGQIKKGGLFSFLGSKRTEK